MHAFLMEDRYCSEIFHTELATFAKDKRHSSPGLKSISCPVDYQEAPVAQYVKRWPANLEVPGLRAAEGGNPSVRKRGSIVHMLSFSPIHRLPS